MKKTLLFISLIVMANMALALGPGVIWRCQASDYVGNTWDSSNLDQQSAINAAFQLCRQQSQRPGSCFTARSMCTRTGGDAPVWRCTAYDKRRTVPYTRVSEGPRRIAVNFAEQACLDNSPFPDSCFVPVRQCVLRD